MLKRLFLFMLLTILTCSISYSVFASPSCSVIQYLTKCKVERNRCIEERTMLVEINDRSAERYAEVSIPFSKKERVVIMLAQIEDTMGNIIRQLKKSDYKDRSAVTGYSLYEDNFIKTFELKHNVYPYRIRYQWRYEYEEFIDIIHWIPYLDENITTRYAKLEVQLPLNYPVKIYKQKLDEPVIDTLESNITYTFKVSNLEMPQEEINQVPSQRIMSQVRMVPVHFRWALEGSHESWKEFGNWIYNLNSGSDDLTEADKERFRTLTQSLPGKLDKVKALYKYLQQQTRYINVSIGTGGLKPFPASYVVKNNYGDCKALTVYMKSMLDAVGIPSFYTIVYAGERNPGIIKDVACLQFNHAILCVPLDNDTLFLDCTRQNVPVGYMGTFTQDREAFVIKKDSGYFVRIPSLSAEDVKEESIHQYDLSTDNNCKVSMVVKSQGYKFDYLSSVGNNLNFKDTEELLRERYFNFSSFDLQNWEINQPYMDSTFVLLKASLQLNNYIKSYGTDLGFSIYPLSIANYEKPSDRKIPLLFEYPVNVRDVYVYNLSLPLKPKFLPKNVLIESRFGRYSLEAIYSANVITIVRSFQLFKGEYSLDDYPDFYTFIRKIISNNKLVVMLTK